MIKRLSNALNRSVASTPHARRAGDAATVRRTTRPLGRSPGMLDVSRRFGINRTGGRPFATPSMSRALPGGWKTLLASNHRPLVVPQPSTAALSISPFLPPQQFSFLSLFQATKAAPRLPTDPSLNNNSLIYSGAVTSLGDFEKLWGIRDPRSNLLDEIRVNASTRQQVRSLKQGILSNICFAGMERLQRRSTRRELMQTLATAIRAKWESRGKLSNPERKALCEYTEDEYYPDVNAALRGSMGNRTNVLRRIARIFSGSRKLQPFVGTVYRGTSKLPAFVMEGLKKGSIYCEPAFMSTSRAEWLATEFAEEVLFHVQSKTGVCMDEFTKYADEEEVLFRPGSRFLIDSVTKVKRKGRNPLLVVKMEEMAPRGKYAV